jgi:hypothetical protein
MDDEPLSEWAEHRDAKIGRLRVVPLTSDERAERLASEPRRAPRHPAMERALLGAPWVRVEPRRGETHPAPRDQWASGLGTGAGTRAARQRQAS